MGEFYKIWIIQNGIQLFNRSINLFLNKIGIELDGNLAIDRPYCSRWQGELGRKTVKS